MTPPPDDHDCGWKAYAKAQEEKLAELTAQVAELQRRISGKRSERRMSSKLPPPVVDRRTAEQAAERRKELAALRASRLTEETVTVPVPPEQCTCPSCGATNLRSVGNGKSSTVMEYVQSHFRKRTHWRQTLACRCGHVVTAPAPDRVGEKTRYAPSFCAHLAVAKCRDSLPLYRLEKAYKSIGIPISRSTMTDLLHRTARELAPLYAAACALVPLAPDVHADETSLRQQGRAGRTYLWDFVTEDLVLYVYATSRSGETPSRVLGTSQGRLVVDQHTGYNAVTQPGGRVRAGCLAHARRKLYEQRAHPEVALALDLIGEIYLVEREAKQAGILGTQAHLELRRKKSRPLFARLLVWGRRHRHRFDPKSGLARAIRYLLKHFRELGRFLRYASIPPDNNRAEAELRRVALGRANFLFVGNEDAGHNLAVLYTLVASCDKRGISPIDYLTDVLLRVHSHPARNIADLLPHRWNPLPARR